MPEIAANKERWDGGHDWQFAGEEWSEAWGGSAYQWRGTLFPRLLSYLPAKRILEIAPGYGRWTQYLAEHCQELIGVDLSVECVAALRQRFTDPKFRFECNDGKSLPTVADRSIDFAFSFGSLIHVESDVIYSYLTGLARVLTDDGVAFLHHSHVAASPLLEARPRNKHWRGETVSGDVVIAFCQRLGLSVWSQERLSWTGTPNLVSDCFSVIGRQPRLSQIVENRLLGEEQAQISALARIYP